MSFNIPTLAQLCERARSAFRSNLRGTDAWLPFNNVYVSAKVIAGAVYEVFGFADYIAQQKFALTADSEHLELHGQELGLARKEARPAQFVVDVTTDAAAAIEAGAICERSDGLRYRATAVAAIGGAGTLTVPVTAVDDGSAPNMLTGTSVEWVSGVSGSITASSIASIAALGTDAEPDGPKFSTDLATYRGRILFRKRNPPHSGAPADYVTWCGEIAGVTRTFVERRWDGAGTVRVFPLMDGLFDHGIPDGDALDRVRDYIEAVAPATAIVTIAAPTAVPVDLTIASLSPDTPAMREAVLSALRETFRRMSRVAGSDTTISSMPYLAYPTSFSRSWLWQAIANATGEERHIITLPEADIALTVGQMAVLGDVTFEP